MSERDVERPAKAIHIDEIEGMPGPGTLTWHPVRATLGIRAFGTNAYTAIEPGVDVVEPHTETPRRGQDRAHEELYFVARGRATFTIDGEDIDAPAGTYVFVPDPPRTATRSRPRPGPPSSASAARRPSSPRPGSGPSGLRRCARTILSPRARFSTGALPSTR